MGELKSLKNQSNVKPTQITKILLKYVSYESKMWQQQIYMEGKQP